VTTTDGNGSARDDHAVELTAAELSFRTLGLI
jgi:hypothetical protein